MEKTFSGVVIVSIVAIVLPAWSQFSTTQGQSPQQNVPGTGALPSQVCRDCLEANPARR